PAPVPAHRRRPCLRQRGRGGRTRHVTGTDYGARTGHGAATVPAAGHVMVITFAVLAVIGLAWLLRPTGDGDTPARIAAVTANRLPAHGKDGGRAMAAELTQVSGRARRWQFAAGLLRVMLFPPPRHPARVLAAALGGLLAAVGATAAAAAEVPSLAVFAAILGLLLGGYATVAASRSHRLRPTVPRVAVGAEALAGVAAAVAAVVRIAVAYPAATTDRTHAFSVLFALALAGRLALAFGPVPP